MLLWLVDFCVAVEYKCYAAICCCLFAWFGDEHMMLAVETLEPFPSFCLLADVALCCSNIMFVVPCWAAWFCLKFVCHDDCLMLVWNHVCGLHKMPCCVKSTLHQIFPMIMLVYCWMMCCCCFACYEHLNPLLPCWLCPTVWSLVCMLRESMRNILCAVCLLLVMMSTWWWWTWFDDYMMMLNTLCCCFELAHKIHMLVFCIWSWMLVCCMIIAACCCWFWLIDEAGHDTNAMLLFVLFHDDDNIEQCFGCC